MAYYSKRLSYWLSGWRNQPLESAEDVLAAVHGPKTIFEDAPQTALIINNVRIAHMDDNMAKKLWRVECRGAKVFQVSLVDEYYPQVEPQPDRQAWYEIDAGGSILLPSCVIFASFVE